MESKRDAAKWCASSSAAAAVVSHKAKLRHPHHHQHHNHRKFRITAAWTQLRPICLCVCVSCCVHRKWRTTCEQQAHAGLAGYMSAHVATHESLRTFRTCHPVRRRGRPAVGNIGGAALWSYTSAPIYYVNTRRRISRMIKHLFGLLWVQKPASLTEDETMFWMLCVRSIGTARSANNDAEMWLYIVCSCLYIYYMYMFVDRVHTFHI